jgi:hypothetical protein
VAAGATPWCGIVPPALAFALDQLPPLALGVQLMGGESNETKYGGEAFMEFFKVPEALQWEHDLIRQQLARAVGEGGRTGSAAEALVAALRPHVVKEEDFALPALGLLQHLVADRVSPVMRGVIVMTDRLKAQYDQMLADHEVIVAAVDALAEAATREGKPEYVGFTKQLLRHIKTEEQVLYPAAILIGEYLKLKLERVVRS